MTGLNELELLNLDSEGKPPVESRLKDAASAAGIYGILKKADERSSINRARVQALFDGAPPYDPGLLRSTGQGQRTNLNFGEAGRYLDIAVSGYVDLINAVQTLVNVTSTVGEESDRNYDETVIAEEITRTLRDWPEFHTSYLRLVNEFLIHGVGITYFEDPTNWRFRTCGFGDCLIPRQTLASEASVEVAIFRRSYMLHELYAFIRDEAKATALGWDVNEVKEAMLTASTGSTVGRSFGEWERLESQIKNNDLYNGVQYTSVPILHALVREFDGSVSHFILRETSPTTFMFKAVKRFEHPEQAFIFFTNGVGTNGTYHSIRGLGQKIFPHIQVSNRLRSQAVDGAMLASSVMIQPDSQRTLDELNLTYYGPYTVLSPNISLVEKAIPNLSTAVIPIINDVSEQMAQNLDFFTTRGAAAGSPYRTKLQVEAELEAATRLTASNLNLFYASWRRLLREITKRIITGPKTDPDIRDFFARCEERGVPEKIVESIDFASTTAVKAIGSGNASARSAALNDLAQLMPLLDETGRKNLVFDRVAARIGYDSAGRYASQADTPRPNSETKTADLENAIMEMGRPVEVLPTEMHETHLRVQLPLLQQFMAALDSGEADPMRVLPVMQLVTDHCGKHTEYLSQDPSAESFAASAREVMANAGMVLNNLLRQQQKAVREAPEGGNPGAGQEDPKLQQQILKNQELQLRMQLLQQQAEAKERREEMKFQQALALKDAAAAAKLQQS